MMTKPLLAILLLLPLSVSAGELDGKSIVCELLNPKPEVEAFQAGAFSHLGFTFKDDNVASQVVAVDGTKAIVAKFKHDRDPEEDRSPEAYKATLTTVTWANGYWVLDRKTLKLAGTNNTLWGYSPKLRCEAQESLDSYKATMERHRGDMQKQLDKLTKDNKI